MLFKGLLPSIVKAVVIYRRGFSPGPLAKLLVDYIAFTRIPPKEFTHCSFCRQSQEWGLLMWPAKYLVFLSICRITTQINNAQLFIGPKNEVLLCKFNTPVDHRRFQEEGLNYAHVAVLTSRQTTGLSSVLSIQQAVLQGLWHSISPVKC